MEPITKTTGLYLLGPIKGLPEWVGSCCRLWVRGNDPRFAIDAVFIAKKKRVTNVAANLKPWCPSASFRAHNVVEFPAGNANRTDTGPGDQPEIVEA